MGGWTLGLAALVLLGLGARRALTADPFADFRIQNQSAMDEKPAVVLEDTLLRGYRDGKETLVARVDRLEMTRDRNVVRATRLVDGIFRENDKTVWKFEADRGLWQDQLQALQLEGNIRARSENMDLKVQKVEYSHLTQDFRVPDQVKGRLFQGELEGRDLKLNFKTSKWSVQDVQWVGLIAQNQTADAPAPVPTNRPWKFTAKSASGESQDREIYFEARATNGEVEIRADKIERIIEAGTRREILIATGNVRYFGQDANMLCERVTVFRQERRAVMEGRVTMLIKPESEAGLKPEPLQPLRPIVPEEIAIGRPSANPPTRTPADDELRRTDNRRKYPVRVLAQRIEYWYGQGQKRAVATGNPQARQELPEGRWRMIWSPRADWDGEAEFLTLTGAKGKQEVRVRQSNGDAARADMFGVSTARDNERWTADNVSAEGEVDDEEIPGTTGGSGGTQTNPNKISGPIG